jgi:hypothetical protein
MIQPEFKPLIDVLSGKLFSIPEYQRHYSWTRKQRIDLFRDILKLMDARKIYEDRVHFMATIVCLKTHDRQQVGSNSFYVYEVVDGQQRLTTLIILLKAISLRLGAESQIDEEKELNKLLVKDDGRLLILQNNHDNRMLLRNYLQYGTVPLLEDIKTAADANINEAIKDCTRFVNSPTMNTIGLLSLVKNYLYFIFQYLEDKGAVYTIFEVLNSRGLEVDWLDKCKSMLMGLLYEHSGNVDDGTFEQHLIELHRYWSDIYTEIGLQSIHGQEIIRFAATLQQDGFAGRPISAEAAVEYFREDCMKSGARNQIIKNIKENTIWLKKVTSALSTLYKDNRRNAVTEITQARLMAISIMLRTDLVESDRNKLLEQWERTTFRIYGLLDNDARVKVGDFVRVSKAIFKEKSLPLDTLKNMVYEIGKEFPIEAAINALRTKDCYTGWQRKLRYFFYRYDEYLSLKMRRQINEADWSTIWRSNVNDSIEHILPQDRSKNCWSSVFDDDLQKRLVNTIGNLCLLSQPLNSSGRNNCFAQKVEIYKRTNLLSNQNILTMTNGESRVRWESDDILFRTEQLLAFAKEQWRDLD